MTQVDVLIKTSCQLLADRRRRAENFVGEKTDHRDSGPTALIKPCVHVSSGEAIHYPPSLQFWRFACQVIESLRDLLKRKRPNKTN